MTDINGLKIGETKIPIIGIVTREAQLSVMFEESREHINRVFKHEQIYKDLMLACLVSRSKIGLEGYRGCIAEGQKVFLADGRIIPIEQVKKGDMVISFNDEKNLYEPDLVKEVIFSGVKDVY